jgi:pimeloyl-ACP methyl ester carboxylesterase
MRRILKWTVVPIASVYLLLCVGLYLHQSKFIFIPQREVEFTPRDFGCSFEEVRFESGGKVLHGWWIPGDAQASALVGAGTVGVGMAGDSLIYFHGNGGSIGANAAHACRLSRVGFGVLIFDYRGYGKSEGGPPTVNRVYEDAEQAWQYLLRREAATSPAKDDHGPGQGGRAQNETSNETGNEAAKEAGNHRGRTVIYGHSLGGAVAIELAKRHPEAGALIVESTFTSIREMAKQSPMFRPFPTWLVVNQMDSLKSIAQVRMPVLLIHGTADGVVPAQMAEKLYAAAPGRKQILLVTGAGHENCASVAGPRYAQAVAEFMKTSF